MTGVRVLFDEPVGRVFERLLRERGYGVRQVEDRFGERTADPELLKWCVENAVVLVTNNAKAFEPLHRTYDHAGVSLYRDQKLPARDPEGLARTVDEVFHQYGARRGAPSVCCAGPGSLCRPPKRRSSLGNRNFQNRTF